MEQFAALLPMKGHSERVPNKNMRLFGGKPLYHSMVNTLLMVPEIKIIVINTDSEKIESDVRENFPEKVQINIRPENIRGDFVSMNEIINHDISILKPFEFFIQTHSTNPLLKSETIETAIKNFIRNKEQYDSSFSVTRLQTRLYWKDGKPINHNPDELVRTQDLPPVYEENSNFYIFSKNSFLGNNKKRIGKKPLMHEMNKIEAIDIDEEVDFLMAEALLKIF